MSQKDGPRKFQIMAEMRITQLILKTNQEIHFLLLNLKNHVDTRVDQIREVFKKRTTDVTKAASPAHHGLGHGLRIQ